LQWDMIEVYNQTFTTIYRSIHLGYPLACMRDLACYRGPASIGTSESDPGLYAGPGVYLRPGFYPKFYGNW